MKRNRPFPEGAFKSPIVGIDPVTKGILIIMWACVFELPYNIAAEENVRAAGAIKIPKNNNPLYELVKDNPLRLQNLLASVDFGIEKRFIQIKCISDFADLSMFEGGEEHIELRNVDFNILDNLDYLEAVQTYRDDNIL